MTVIYDYGVGNLFSLKSSFAAIGSECIVSCDPADLRAADRIVLPGVGAFGDAARLLFESNGLETLLEEVGRGKPLLGLCLGMQLLFDKSYEFGEHRGLGLIGGEVRPLSDILPRDSIIPHMGYNSLNFHKRSAIFRDVREGDHMYYVHSFYARPSDPADIDATSEYDGACVTGAVSHGNIFGVQFHPEKSGKAGLALLRAFVTLQ